MDCLDVVVLRQLVRKELPGEERAECEGHLRGCAACRARLALAAEEVQAPASFDSGTATPDLSALGDSVEALGPDTPPGSLARGISVGRYLVLDKLGQGGMGEVYAAFDPQLGRRVALKLLLPHGEGALARERLLREAQAMAQLSHPNVLPVFDVGEHEGRVFIAMELVEGTTLRPWLKAGTQRPWRQVLRPFLDAGRGLAAAHAAGLVHRDFKPDNVLLSRDGRVYVMDFGLARVGGDGSRSSSTSGSGEVSGPPTLELTGSHSVQRTGLLASHLTQHRQGVIGTPGYMPPEQIRNEEVDARADVFAFCVALYAALHGHKPFAGDGARAVLEATLAGTLVPPPRDTRVPAWLHKVLLKGLAGDREQRWPSMEALLTALQDDPAVRLRRWGLAAAALVLLAAGVAVPRVRAAREEAACEAEGAAFAQAVWGPERRAAVERAFRATGVPYVETTLRSVAGALEAYAARGQAQGAEACLATRVRAEASAAEYGLKRECLAQRRAEAGALLDVFVQADAKLVEKAVVAASKLPALDACADTDALLRQVKPPQSPAVAAQVAEVRGVLLRARAQATAGRWAAARTLLEPLVARAAALDYAPVHAEVLEALGRIQWNLSRAQEGTRALRDAIVAAEASNHDTVKLAAATNLILVMAEDKTQAEAARDVCKWAFALAHRMPRDDRALGELHGRCGWIDIRQDRPAEAEPAMRKALELAIAASGPDSVDAIVARNALGAAFMGQRKLEEAQRLYAELLPHVERSLGAEHPWLAVLTSNLCMLEEKLGLHAQSLATAERARTLYERARLEAHAGYFRTLTVIGKRLHTLGRDAEALAQARTALEVGERTQGASSVELVDPLALQATVLVALGRPAEAVAPAERAAALVRRAPGEGSTSLARAVDGVRGQVLLAQGRARKALPLLEASLAHLELPATAAAPWEVGFARFHLAQAQVAAGLPRTPALQLAARARDALAQPGGERGLPQVEAWLRAHAPGQTAGR